MWGDICNNKNFEKLVIFDDLFYNIIRIKLVHQYYVSFGMFYHQTLMRIYKKKYLKISTPTFELSTEIRYFDVRDFVIRVSVKSGIFYSGLCRIIHFTFVNKGKKQYDYT